MNVYSYVSIRTTKKHTCPAGQGRYGGHTGPPQSKRGTAQEAIPQVKPKRQMGVSRPGEEKIIFQASG